MAPEPVDAARILGVREQKPEAEDGLSKHVQDAVGDDLGIDRPLPRSVRDAPYDRIQGPENQREATDGSE